MSSTHPTTNAKPPQCSCLRLRVVLPRCYCSTAPCAEVEHFVQSFGRLYMWVTWPHGTHRWVEPCGTRCEGVPPEVRKSVHVTNQGISANCDLWRPMEAPTSKGCFIQIIVLGASPGRGVDVGLVRAKVTYICDRDDSCATDASRRGFYHHSLPQLPGLVSAELTVWDSK